MDDTILININTNIEELKKLLEQANAQAKQLSETMQEINKFKLMINNK